MKKLSTIFVCATMAFGTAGGAAYAGGDAEKGAAAYKTKCGSCHSVEAGKHKMGPSMAGIYGMKAGGTDFTRYVGLKDADFSWDDESLDGFLADPKTFLGGKTSMPIPLPDAAIRHDIIAYLKTLN